MNVLKRIEALGDCDIEKGIYSFKNGIQNLKSIGRYELTLGGYNMGEEVRRNRTYPIYIFEEADGSRCTYPISFIKTMIIEKKFIKQ